MCLQSPAGLLIILCSEISLICTVGETHYWEEGEKWRVFSIRIQFINLSVDYNDINIFSSLWLSCWSKFVQPVENQIFGRHEVNSIQGQA